MSKSDGDARDSEELSPEDRRVLKRVVDDIKTNSMTRRAALALGAGATAGAAGAGGFVVGQASAAASTADSDGDIGQPGDRVDAFVDGVDVKSIKDASSGNAYDVDRLAERIYDANLTELVNDGTYSDILAAIQGEAADNAVLYIEDGTYSVSTAATVSDISNVRVFCPARGSKWNQNTFPVRLEWTGTAGSDMLSVTTPNSDVEGWHFEGISFDGGEAGAGTGANHAIRFNSDGNQNRDHAFVRCGFQHTDGRPIERTGTNPAEVYDFEFRECSVFKNNAPITIPAQSEWYGGYVVANATDGAALGMECHAEVNVFGVTAAPQNGATAILHNGMGTIIPANIEGDGSTGSAGIEIRSKTSIPGGRITNCDVGIEVGDPSDSTVNANGCFIAGIRIQNHTTAKIRFNGGANNHNDTIIMSTDAFVNANVAFNNDAQGTAFIHGLNRATAATDVLPGSICIDSINNRLALGDAEGAGHVVNFDTTL